MQLHALACEPPLAYKQCVGPKFYTVPSISHKIISRDKTKKPKRLLWTTCLLSAAICIKRILLYSIIRNSMTRNHFNFFLGGTNLCQCNLSVVFIRLLRRCDQTRNNAFLPLLSYLFGGSFRSLSFNYLIFG